MDAAARRPMVTVSLSIKLLTVIFVVVALFSMAMYYFSLSTTQALTEAVKETSGAISSISLKEFSSSLNEQAEKYLGSVANSTAKSIGDYMERRRFDIQQLIHVERTPESFIRFSVNRREYAHNLSGTAPVQGVSFPNERDTDEVERVPTFSSLVYIDRNGMEKVRVENDMNATSLSDVSGTDYFRQASKLGPGEIGVLLREYVIWDCTKRQSTLIGEQLYTQEGPCPRAGINTLNATGWKRFTSGHIRYFAPVYDGGAFNGVIVADVNFLPIMRIVNDVKTGLTGYAYLQQAVEGTAEGARGEGITVAHPSHQYVLGMDPGTLYRLNLSGLDDLRDLSMKQQLGASGVGRYVFRGVDKYTSYASYNESGILWSVGITSPVEEFTSPAKSAQEKISVVARDSSRRTLDTTENSLFFFLQWLVVLLVVLLAVILLIVSVMVTRPLKKLRDAAVEIGRGNLGARASLKSGDEMGQLADSFNRMAADLGRSHVAIKSHAEELERKVEERTNELDQKIEELSGSKAAVLNMMEDMDEANKELVKTQDELKKSLSELRVIDVKKDEFISIAAHELKTPLTSIHGFSQLLHNMSVINDPEKREKYLGIMETETLRLAHLVNDILDLSRVDFGTLKFELSPVDLAAFMDDVEKEMNIQIKKKGLTASFVIEKKLPKITTDRERLTQILINIINNAVKYTPKGSINVRVFMDNGMVHFTVKDTGIGIAKEHRDKIFTRFYQVDSSYTRSSGGTGLGLSLCREFVEMLGGKIWFESEAGKGSEFHFTLPEEAPAQEDKKEYKKAEENIRKADAVSKRSGGFRGA